MLDTIFYMMIKMIIIWALALLFGINSVFVSIRTSFTFGTFLMWAVTAALFVYAIFHRQIDAFCKNGVGRVLKFIFLGMLLFFIGMFIFVAVSGYIQNAKGDEKAIIVLGAGLKGENVSDVLRRRLAAAKDAFDENPNAVIVVTGGQGPQEVIPEALAMQRWLLANGVPEDKIILEDKSTSTEENLLFARALLEDAGISANEPVAVVSNAFHCYRAGQYAKKLGFSNARTIPASMNMGSLLPSYMREVFAILYMWVFKHGSIV